MRYPFAGYIFGILSILLCSINVAFSQTKSSSLLNKAFSQHKGKLPFPVAKGFIINHFGKQEHPSIKGVMLNNYGIDIRTNPGESVRSVHEGVVSTVATVPGMTGKVVMIQHGEYFTVYAKVKNLLVNVGQKVRVNQMIATVFMDNKGISILQFQIWKGNKKLNPIEWLLRR